MFKPSQNNISRRTVLRSLAGSGAAVAVGAGFPAIVFAARKIDNSIFAGLLKEYLRPKNGINNVAYKAMLKGGHKDIKAYVAYLEKINPKSLSRTQEMAFWINLYNAKTIDVVLDHYPVKSIRDISLGGGFFSKGPWKAKVLKVAGRKLSLDDVEHVIARPKFKTPLLHYGFNCASISCPNLQKAPYEGGTIEKFLIKGARSYINHSRGVTVKKNRITASKLFRWYMEDFQADGGVKEHWAKYAKAQKASEIKAARSVNSYVYDWGLNDAS